MEQFAICAFMLLVSAIAFYFLSLRLVSQVFCHRAEGYARQGNYGLAARLLETARSYQPTDAALWRELGETYYRLGERPATAQAAFIQTRKSKDAYLRAREISPLDASSAYGLARTESRLEDLYRRGNPGDTDIPYDPMPYFAEAIRLSPNDVRAYYALARYLHRQQRTDELLETIRKMGRIYPLSYPSVTKEAFWGPLFKDAFRSGLEDAVREGISPRSAHEALSALLAEDEKWTEAIIHSRQALESQGGRKAAKDLFHLGRLYLKNGQLVEAESAFLKGMQLSRNVDKDLEGLHRLYQREGHSKDIQSLHREVGRRFSLSPQTDILLARALMDLKQFREARQILETMTRSRPSAETYYWLARVGEKEQDWDAMELAIQKATVLDPANTRYHQVFAGLLKRLGKYQQAEEALGLAIEQSDTPSPLLLSERARIRHLRRDDAGALRDWEAAIQNSRPRAGFYAEAAEVCVKLRESSQALDYYRKALALEPQNNRYAKRYGELSSLKSVQQ
jgi:tetratricopeptide (TPR) repeat protein